MATITAPDPAYAGVMAGVTFTNGVGASDHPAVLAFLTRRGYTVEQDQSEPALVAEPEHRDPHPASRSRRRRSE